MKVELSYDELVLLIELANQRFCELQREDPNNTTPFEVQLFKKLYDAHMLEMGIMKREQQANEGKG